MHTELTETDKQILEIVGECNRAANRDYIREMAFARYQIAPDDVDKSLKRLTKSGHVEHMITSYRSGRPYRLAVEK